MENLELFKVGSWYEDPKKELELRKATLEYCKNNKYFKPNNLVLYLQNKYQYIITIHKASRLIRKMIELNLAFKCNQTSYQSKIYN